MGSLAGARDLLRGPALPLTACATPDNFLAFLDLSFPICKVEIRKVLAWWPHGLLQGLDQKFRKSSVAAHRSQASPVLRSDSVRGFHPVTARPPPRLPCLACGDTSGPLCQQNCSHSGFSHLDAPLPDCSLLPSAPRSASPAVSSSAAQPLHSPASLGPWGACRLPAMDRPSCPSPAEPFPTHQAQGVLMRPRGWAGAAWQLAPTNPEVSPFLPRPGPGTLSGSEDRRTGCPWEGLSRSRLRPPEKRGPQEVAGICPQATALTGWPGSTGRAPRRWLRRSCRTRACPPPPCRHRPSCRP